MNQQDLKKSGTLYLIPTPIGNLGDITIRAIEVMKSANLLLAEDTRVTRKLLNHYDIKVPTKSYHSYNEKRKLIPILDLLKAGKTIALVSDAGMPGISDPGLILIAACREEGIPVYVLPGASAGITAMISSGFKVEGHQFLGFLPQKLKELNETLLKISLYDGAVVIYEAPHRVKKVLEKMAEIMPERQLHIAREMTKLHEEHIYGTVREVSEKLDRTETRGEYVIILGPLEGDSERGNELDYPRIGKFKNLCAKLNISVRDAASLYSCALDRNKSEIYRVMNKMDVS